MKEIKIQDKLETDLNTLNTAIEAFEPYSNNFAQTCANNLDSLNSDFISKIKETLEVMKDTKAPELLKKIKEYHENGVALVNTFKEADKKIAKNEQMIK